MAENQFLSKKILITGGIGFIGSNLAMRLVELGAELTLVDSLIPEYGGNQIRDFNYADDAVNAFLLAAGSEDADGEIYNLGADDPINLKDTAEMLIKVSGEGTYEIVPFPQDRKVIDIGDYYGDFRKIRSRLGWKPEVSLEEGLRKTLDFYRRFYGHYWETEKGA